MRMIRTTLAYNTSGKKRSEKQRRFYYRDHWRRQMSDHLIMWLELKMDYDREYLKKRSAGL